MDPGVDMKTSIRDQVNAMDAATYFKLFAQLLKANPPVADDAPMVAKLAKIGIVPGQDFDASKLDPAVAKGLAEVPKPAQDKIMDWMKEASSPATSSSINGWAFTTKTGIYGTNYRQRALITAIGLGANRPQDARVPDVDGSGHRQEIQRREQVRDALRQGRVAAGQRLLVADDVRRATTSSCRTRSTAITVSQRNKLKANADGSIDLFVQNESPGKDKEQNWLPRRRTSSS